MPARRGWGGRGLAPHSTYGSPDCPGCDEPEGKVTKTYLGDAVYLEISTNGLFRLLCEAPADGGPPCEIFLDGIMIDAIAAYKRRAYDRLHNAAAVASVTASFDNDPDSTKRG